MISLLLLAALVMPAWTFHCTPKQCSGTGSYTVKIDDATGLYWECHWDAGECRVIPGQTVLCYDLKRRNYRPYKRHKWYQDCVLPNIQKEVK